VAPDRFPRLRSETLASSQAMQKALKSEEIPYLFVSLSDETARKSTEIELHKAADCLRNMKSYRLKGLHIQASI
jgi:hypothetical protein